MFKFNNIKEIKTTIIGLCVALLVVAKFIWPDKVSDVSEEEVTNIVTNIIEGIAGLVAVFTLVFGSKDG